MAAVGDRIDGWWNDSTAKWFTVRVSELRSSTTLQSRGGKNTAARFCALTTPSFLSSGTPTVPCS